MKITLNCKKAKKYLSRISPLVGKFTNHATLTFRKGVVSLDGKTLSQNTPYRLLSKNDFFSVDQLPYTIKLEHLRDLIHHTEKTGIVEFEGGEKGEVYSYYDSLGVRVITTYCRYNNPIDWHIEDRDYRYAGNSVTVSQWCKIFDTMQPFVTKDTAIPEWKQLIALYRTEHGSAVFASNGYAAILKTVPVALTHEYTKSISLDPTVIEFISKSPKEEIVTLYTTVDIVGECGVMFSVSPNETLYLQSKIASMPLDKVLGVVSPLYSTSPSLPYYLPEQSIAELRKGLDQVSERNVSPIILVFSDTLRMWQYDNNQGYIVLKDVPYIRVDGQHHTPIITFEYSGLRAVLNAVGNSAKYEIADNILYTSFASLTEKIYIALSATPTSFFALGKVF